METSVVYYLYISFSCFSELFKAPRGFSGGKKPKEQFSVNPFCKFCLSLCLHLSIPLSLSVTVSPYLSVCPSLCLSEKGTHPRLSGPNLHGDLILTNPRTVVFQLRPSVLHQPVITDHWIELLLFSRSGSDPHLMTCVCVCVCVCVWIC